MPRPDPVPGCDLRSDFGWPRRARLLLADLFVFDPQRLGWRLAIRTMIGLLVPMELAHLLAMPALTWVGIGAYLVAIGDSTDDGDRQQTLRLVMGSVLGGLALASGVLAGAALVLAVILMVFWGMLAGLIGVYGNAFATMGLPIAWAYVELGLPIHDHSLASAARFGALFALGGAITLVCTALFRIAGPYAPLKRQTEACFRAVASYLDKVANGREDDPRALISSETNVRATIAEARRIAGALRRGQHGWSLIAQRLLVLIEIAERLFALAALLREGAGLASIPSPSLAFFADCTREVADALSVPLKAETPRSALARLDPVTARGEEAADIAGQARQRMAVALAHAIRITLGDEMPEPVPAPPSPSAASGLSAWLAPLAQCLDQCLDPESVVARHALRFGIVAAVAVIIFRFFPSPFGYWIPLTVTVVLKPYAGATLARTVQRIIGTGAGILVSAALMPFLAGPEAELAAVFIFFFCMMLVLPFNYSLAIFFLSAGSRKECRAVAAGRNLHRRGAGDRRRPSPLAELRAQDLAGSLEIEHRIDGGLCRSGPGEIGSGVLRGSASPGRARYHQSPGRDPALRERDRRECGDDGRLGARRFRLAASLHQPQCGGDRRARNGRAGNGRISQGAGCRAPEPHGKR